MKFRILIFLIIISVLCIAGVKTSSLPCKDSPPINQYDNFGRLVKSDYGMCGDYCLDSITYFFEGNKKTEKVFFHLGSQKYYYENIYDYNENQKMIKSENDFGTNRIIYNNKSQIVKEISAGLTTTYDYDELGRVTCLNCQPDATGIPEEYQYDLNGNVITHKKGVEILQQEFDGQGNLIRKSSYSGSADFVYEEGVLQRIDDSGYFEESLSANNCGSFDNYTYDENCRVIRDDLYSYEYDSLWNVIRQISLETGNVITYDYENFTLKTIDFPDNSFLDYSYGSGELYSVSDGNKRLYLSPFDFSSMVSQEELLSVSQVCSGDCGETENYSCQDKIKNGYEEGIDCGLSCWKECTLCVDIPCDNFKVSGLAVLTFTNPAGRDTINVNIEKSNGTFLRKKITIVRLMPKQSIVSTSITKFELLDNVITVEGKAMIGLSDTGNDFVIKIWNNPLSKDKIYYKISKNGVVKLEVGTKELGKEILLGGFVGGNTL